MTKVILGFDPGEATGWSTWILDENAPALRADYGLIKNGIDGFITWVARNLIPINPDVIVCEEFRLGGDVIDPPLVGKLIEGSLLTSTRALGRPDPVWQRRTLKRAVPDRVLKQGGLWLTGSDERIKWSDARDVNDSQINVLTYLKHIEHQPTLRTYWPDA